MATQDDLEREGRAYLAAKLRSIADGLESGAVVTAIGNWTPEMARLTDAASGRVVRQAPSGEETLHLTYYDTRLDRRGELFS